MLTVRFFILLFLVAFSIPVFSQSIEEIKKKQEKTEKEINYLNTLLKNAQNNQSATQESLQIIEEKIKKGKDMVASLTEEINLLEYAVSGNEKKQSSLNSDRRKMLDLYGKLVYETWKRKNHRLDKIAFIFSSSDFAQAYARYRYFEQIQDYSKQQIRLIERTNDSLRVINRELANLLSQKNDAQSRLSQQNGQLIVEMNQANDLVKQLKKKEQEINKKLNIEIQNREKYKKELQKLIENQIKMSGSKTSKYKLTPEEKLISDDFVKNKGHLPWPVTEGFISEGYGTNVSSSSRNVVMQNDGITITTSGKAEVRAVFGGMVVETMLYPGKNNIVLIRHGNYFTLYDNLIELHVEKGETVQVKQKIGRLAPDKSGNSAFNFQIWRDKEKENPQLWLSK
jgi:septal ring factor EnvC (AmiA/AmiB activator)